MNVSSLLQNSSIFSTSSATGSTRTQNTKSEQSLSELLKKLSGQQDGVSISTEGLTRSKMPPQKVDFTAMSDEDLSGFLTQMQERTGSIPGFEYGAVVSDLTSEQLQSIRDKLTEMSAEMDERMSKMQGKPPHGMGGMQGPPPMDIQNMSDDNLKSLIETIKSDTGSIPGIDYSESIDVSSLTDEQLQKVRDALEEMMKKRMEEMRQSMTMSNAISAYEKNGGLAIE